MHFRISCNFMKAIIATVLICLMAGIPKAEAQPAAPATAPAPVVRPTRAMLPIRIRMRPAIHQPRGVIISSSLPATRRTDGGVKQQLLPEALEYAWKDYPTTGQK